MIIFKPWRPFQAYRDREVTSRFLDAVAKEAEDKLKEGIRNPPKTGRMYRRRYGMHQASVNMARQEYPANDYGRLLASVRNEVTPDSATIGTTVYYARFLRDGTKKMRRRKMSDDAMTKVLGRAMKKLRGWVVWKRF